jgi:colicin import membrane protein
MGGIGGGGGGKGSAPPAPKVPPPPPPPTQAELNKQALMQAEAQLLAQKEIDKQLAAEAAAKEAAAKKAAEEKAKQDAIEAEKKRRETLKDIASGRQRASSIFGGQTGIGRRDPSGRGVGGAGATGLLNGEGKDESKLLGN